MAIRLNSKSLSSSSLLSAIPALAALLFSAGCGDTACFKWTEAEGECPAQDDALIFFEEPSCHRSDIKSVDSDPTFDDDACCYSVTKWRSNEERTFICQ